ncbi:hypothetical protein [Thalassoglobus polymorphus]|uniref:DUF262 domain-containing protein n=1 Tax=Thalassoglobus polymorphus TaxID=2527994 RepID=A0A517QK90_9PLAN|nr:hypothetical protein [Thalassoglobus polymorphus]QDT32059.1 hypothetical protein Mal48_12990 [Thalassoglobus polymorphus]
MTEETIKKQTPLSMRTVDELRLNTDGQPQRYFIANYQRGYRWSTTQVTQLLGDIREFTILNNSTIQSTVFQESAGSTT